MLCRITRNYIDAQLADGASNRSSRGEVKVVGHGEANCLIKPTALISSFDPISMLFGVYE